MSRTLREAVMQKAIEFKFKTTVEPNMLIIPRTTGMVKSFCEALAQEVPEAGRPHHIFHKLWFNNDRCHYTCGDYVLEVVLSNTDTDLCVDYSPEAVLEHEEPGTPQIIH